MCGIEQNKGCICAASNRIRNAYVRHQTEQGVRMCGIKQNKGCVCAASNRTRGAYVRHQIE